jgi:hypothetical protein
MAHNLTTGKTRSCGCLRVEETTRTGRNNKNRGKKIIEIM